MIDQQEGRYASCRMRHFECVLHQLRRGYGTVLQRAVRGRQVHERIRFHSGFFPTGFALASHTKSGRRYPIASVLSEIRRK